MATEIPNLQPRFQSIFRKFGQTEVNNRVLSGLYVYKYSEVNAKRNGDVLAKTQPQYGPTPLKRKVKSFFFFLNTWQSVCLHPVAGQSPDLAKREKKKVKWKGTVSRLRISDFP